jgi:hypothetical protein
LHRSRRVCVQRGGTRTRRRNLHPRGVTES